MFDFLSARLKERQAARAALVEQETLKQERRAQLDQAVKMVKDLLRDSRYEAYAKLLRETHQACLHERETLLQHGGDPRRIDVLTGRILQLDHILKTPEQFLALAEQDEANAQRGIAPVERHPRLVAAKTGV